MSTLATALQTTQPLIRSRAKTALFAVLGVMVLYVLQHNERFLVNRSEPVWQHFEPFKWWLLPHGLAGACALILGPMQFSERLRKKYTKLHRVAGRFYVGGVVVAAPLGVYIQYIQGFPTFTAAAVAFASAWIFTTLFAMFFILRGNVTQHRHWMTRSFCFALVFIVVRFLEGVLKLDNVSPQIDEACVWFTLVLMTLAADVIIQFQEMPRASK